MYKRLKTNKIIIRCVRQNNFYLPFPATPVLLLCTPATETWSVSEDVAWTVMFLIFLHEGKFNVGHRSGNCAHF